MSSLRFTKMHGLGNDYIYIDGAADAVGDPSSLARLMADRHFGVGGDGVILILPPDDGVHADVRMRMFNADGGEAEMCGNGIRCVCKYAHDHGLSRANPMRIQTARGVLSIDYTKDEQGKVATATVDMGEPILDAERIPVELPDRHDGPIVDRPLATSVSLDAPSEWMADSGLDPRMTCVSLGNPHVVIYGDRISRVPLDVVGPALERQRIFPNRINVHFVEVHDHDEVTVRHWERGSGITLACGTGAGAVCVAGVLTGRSGRRVRAHLPGGDLDIEWSEEDGHVRMTGPAVEVFSGEWRLD
jgi:diaminopimelate epimerase